MCNFSIKTPIRACLYARSVLYVMIFLLLAVCLPQRVWCWEQTLSNAPRLQGKVHKQVPYTDSLGQHRVVLTDSGDRSRPDHDDPEVILESRDLWAYGFSSQQDLEWQMHDFVQECPLTLSARFSPDSPTITMA